MVRKCVQQFFFNLMNNIIQDKLINGNNLFVSCMSRQMRNLKSKLKGAIYP